MHSIKPSSTVKWAGNCDYLDREDNGEIVDLSPNKVCMINDEVRSFADDDDDPNPPSGVVSKWLCWALMHVTQWRTPLYYLLQGNDIDNGGLFSNDGRSILIVATLYTHLMVQGFWLDPSYLILHKHTGETAIAGVNLFNEGRGCIIAGDFTFYSDMVLKNKIPTNKW